MAGPRWAGSRGLSTEGSFVDQLYGHPRRRGGVNGGARVFRRTRPPGTPGTGALPEPATLGLFATALAAIGWSRRKARRA
jgi:hypothetical protein